MKHVKIAYIGGGSKAWAQIIMNDLLLQDQLGGEICLYDIDYDAAKDNQQLLSKLAGLDQVRSQWQVSLSESLEESLIGADFIYFTWIL